MAKYEESSSGAFDSEAENKKKEPVALSIAKRRTEKKAPVGSEAPVELWTFDSEAENIEVYDL